jgi:hypothetical protein
MEDVMDDDALAERLARSDVGERFLDNVTPHFKRHAIERWKDTIRTIRLAGLAVVEAEDGR